MIRAAARDVSRRAAACVGVKGRWLFFTAAMVVAVAWVRLGPLPPTLLDGAEDVSTTVVDRRGAVLYEARSSSGTRAMRLSAGEIPLALADATIAAEDRRFYSHPGIDPLPSGR